MDAATECAARVFAQELGIVGEAFEALKAPDTQIVEDGVPKSIKQNWKKWCLRGHPDKNGGDNDSFIAMETRYSAFKVWFQAQRDAPANRANDRAHQKAQAKQDGDTALEGGRKALEDKKYEDAMVFAEEAIKAYEAYKNLQLRKDDAQKMVLEATKVKEEAEEQIRLREVEKGQKDAEKARITALEREIERLNIEKQNLQTDANLSQMLLNEEWQQKLKVSEERSSASMRELQDNCKVLKNTNENLKAELAEAYKAFDEAWEEEDIGKKKSEKHGWTMPSLFGLFSGGSKKHERSVKDCVKSAIKDKTQKFKDELARVNAELTASKKNVDEVKKEKQKLYDAWDTALVDADVKHTNEALRLKAELATTTAHLADLQSTCKAQESELEEMRAKLTATAEHKEIVKEWSSEAHQARGADKNVVNVMTTVAKDAEDDFQHATAQSLDAELATTKAQLAAQESELRELRELRVKSLAHEKLFEAYARRLQEDQQLLDSWNTVPM